MVRPNKGGGCLLNGCLLDGRNAFFSLVVVLENLPSSFAHEAFRCFLTSFTESSHFTSRNEEPFVLSLRVKELHLVAGGVEGSDEEGKDFDSLEVGLAVLEELTSVQDIVERSASLGGVTDSSRVSTSNEVSDSSTDSGRAMPKHLSGASIEHGRRPDSEDDTFLREGAVVNESLMLLHSGSEGDIVILAPSTERVKEKDRVFVALSEEVLSGLLKHEAMSIMERVSHLEGKDSVGIHGFSPVVNLLRSQSVLVHAVIPHNFLDEAHGLSRDKEVSLLNNSSSVRVRCFEATKGTGGDLFLSVGVEHRLVDDSNPLAVVN